MKHLVWDYEETLPPYYHIYPISYQGEKLMDDDAISLYLPETPANDALVRALVHLLDGLAESLT